MIDISDLRLGITICLMHELVMFIIKEFATVFKYGIQTRPLNWVQVTSQILALDIGNRQSSHDYDICEILIVLLFYYWACNVLVMSFKAVHYGFLKRLARFSYFVFYLETISISRCASIFRWLLEVAGIFFLMKYGALYWFSCYHLSLACSLQSISNSWTHLCLNVPKTTRIVPYGPVVFVLPN